MKLWCQVFFGVLGGAAGLLVVIWVNISIYQGFGETVSFVCVVITLAAMIATLITVLRRLLE